MAQRKLSKTNTIDPVALTAATLKTVRSCPDYHRIGSTTEQIVFQSAWDTLSQDEQNRITSIVNTNAQPAP